VRDPVSTSLFGSKLQISRPVAAFSANTRSFGDVAYSTPRATTG